MSTERVVIVTGGSKGIGAAICKRLAKDGFVAVVNYTSDEAVANDLVAEIGRDNGKAVAVKADVSDASAMKAMFDEAEKHGKLTALVNNAGIMKLAPVVEAEESMFDRHVQTNLKGVFLGLREAGRRMERGGRIVSFSSSVVGLYQPTYGVYAATKAGVEAMTHIAAKELGPKGITVNAIAPGPVATALFLDDKTDEQVAQMGKMIPLGRIAEPEDIAAVISFLVGPDGGWVSGQVLRANGGMV